MVCMRWKRQGKYEKEGKNTLDVVFGVNVSVSKGVVQEHGEWVDIAIKTKTDYQRQRMRIRHIQIKAQKTM